MKKLFVIIVLAISPLSVFAQNGDKTSAFEVITTTDPVIKVPDYMFVNWELFGKNLVWEYQANHPGKDLPDDLKKVEQFFETFRLPSKDQGEVYAKLFGEASTDVDRNAVAREAREFSVMMPLLNNSALGEGLRKIIDDKQKRELYEKITGYVHESIDLLTLLQLVDDHKGLETNYAEDERFQKKIANIKRDYERRVNELRAEAWEEIMEEISREDRDKIDEFLLIDRLRDR